MAKNKTVLITGASGGLGYEFARLFAKDSYNLVLIARQRDKLTLVAQELRKQFGVSVYVIDKNLCKINATRQICDTLIRDAIQVDVLVNNAGFANWGRFETIKPDKTEDEITVNITALTTLTKLLLPQIKQRKGKILNIASMAAFLPGPLMAIYYATKAFVFSFSHALRNELKDSGVTVTVLCPGPTQTGFEKAAGMERSKLFKLFPMSAERVAKIGYAGLQKGEGTVIPGVVNKISFFLLHFAPTKIMTSIARIVNS